MFVLSKKVRFTAVVATVAAAFFMNSCGGKAAKGGGADHQASRGFQTITTPADELEDLKNQLEDQMIPAAVGIGESNNQQIARTVSADNARAALATSIGAQVQRLSESYAQNVNNQAKTIWEEGVRQLTNEHVRGARVHKSVTQYNDETGAYQVFTLIILDPSIFKAAVADAMAREEEFELRVKKDDMMSKLDANIALYNEQYSGR